MMCPCRDCEERHEACHDHCARYREWKKPYLERAQDRLANGAQISEVKERWIRKSMLDRKRRH